MPRQLFRYTPEQVSPCPAFPSGYTADRPLIDIVLVNGNRLSPCCGLVDSGADHCIFPVEYIERLGFDRETLLTGSAHGLGGGFAVYFAEVDIHTAQLGSWRTVVSFSESTPRARFGFLGQMGFFDRFTVTFDWANKTFDVTDRETNV